MNKKLEDKLVSDFPKLYRQKDLDISQTCMCWGIDCGDGWEKLIRKLSEKLEKYNNDNLDEDSIEAIQVKEKYGVLHYYVNHANTKMYKIIEKIEKKSMTTCELCGKKAKLRDGIWLKTLCKKCYNEEDEDGK